MSQDLENTFLNALERDKEKLLRICQVYATGNEDAKDLFQEVIIQIWQSMPAFEGRSSLETWMYRITLNVCLRFRTKSKKKKARFVSIETHYSNISQWSPEVSDHEGQLKKLRQCISKLNEVDKAVITLSLEDLSYREISEITGMKENTVAVRVKRIKKKLLNCISERYD